MHKNLAHDADIDPILFRLFVAEHRSPPSTTINTQFSVGSQLQM
jgi:hypothetical protein